MFTSFLVSYTCVCVCAKPYQNCSSPPSSINGDLALTRKVNVKLVKSYVDEIYTGETWVPTPSSMGYVQSSCGALWSFSQQDLPAPILICVLHRYPIWIGYRGSYLVSTTDINLITTYYTDHYHHMIA